MWHTPHPMRVLLAVALLVLARGAALADSAQPALDSRPAIARNAFDAPQALAEAADRIDLGRLAFGAPGQPGARSWPAARPFGPPRPSRSKLAAGMFLIATRELMGPYFTESVVLLLEYEATGALGVIINRETRVGLEELLPEVAKLSPAQNDKVFLGGPVEPHKMVFLIRSSRVPPQSHRVLEEVFATGSVEALAQIFDEGGGPSRFRAYAGYAGWAPNQLATEVARGDWIIAPAESDFVFDDALPELWEKLVRMHEGLEARAPRSHGPRIARSGQR